MQITLCVVLTILLLAVISFPRKSDLAEIKPPHSIARDLLEALQMMRNAISDYRFDHGTWPGTKPSSPAGQARSSYAKEDPAQVFEQQLVSFSDVTGETSAVANVDCPLGPYFDGHLPVNPIDGLSSVRILGDDEEWPAAPDESTGWIYRPSTGDLRANCRGFVPVSSLRFYDL